MPLNLTNLALGYLDSGQFAEEKAKIKRVFEQNPELIAIHNILTYTDSIRGTADAMHRKVYAPKIPASTRLPLNNLFFPVCFFFFRNARATSPLPLSPPPAFAL